MNCFDDLIGIHRSCNEVAPSSGLYIQDLPGITLSVANSATDGETISGLKMIQSRITHAQNAIVAHARNQLSDIKLNSIIQNDTIGHYKENLITVPLELGKLKGITVKVNQYPYLEFFLSRVWLKLSTSTATNVLIYDLMTGVLLDTLPITTVANVPTAIIINKGYFTNKQRLNLFICINSGESNTYESNLYKSNCSDCNGSDYSNKYISISGGKINTASQKIDSNIETNKGTNGLSLEYSLNCSIESFICNMGNILAWSLLHKVGSEIMKELISSRRLNSVINIDRGTNESLRDEYEAEYMASMTGIMSNLKLPNDICFKCNQNIRRVIAIP